MMRVGIAYLAGLALLLASVGCGSEAPRSDGPHPRVLIIGDSISLGYTPIVTEALAGRAVVVHSPGNAQSTETGVESLDRWLEGGPWDVIHFNWGLWDLCHIRSRFLRKGVRDKVRGEVVVPPDRYLANLELLLDRLQETGATLIWASTTVVPPGEPGRHPGDEGVYNALARGLMTSRGIRINDLHDLSRTFPPDLFIKPGDVHFREEGYLLLANQVTREIIASLP